MVQAFLHPEHLTRLVYHLDGLRHISVHQAHQAIHRCHLTAIIRQVHRQLILHQVQIINLLDRFRTIRQTARIIHQHRLHMVVRKSFFFKKNNCVKRFQMQSSNCQFIVKIQRFCKSKLFIDESKSTITTSFLASQSDIFTSVDGFFFHELTSFNEPIIQPTKFIFTIIAATIRKYSVDFLFKNICQTNVFLYYQIDPNITILQSDIAKLQVNITFIAIININT